MKKILITGLGIGRDFGVCDASNMNYRELLVNPEVLLWADKICVPSSDYYHDDIIDNECKLVFSMLEDRGLIQRYSTKQIDEDRFDYVLEKAEDDLRQISEQDPALVVSNDKSDLEIKARDNMFCIPRIASIYSSLIVADEIQASCLFSKGDKEFFELSFQSNFELVQQALKNKVYREILSCKLPNEPILHKYGAYKGCDICANTDKCKDTYLSDVEKKLSEYLSFRNYDEMVQLRSVIDDIIENKSRLLEDVEIEEVLRDISYRQNFIKDSINRRFKKIKRIANIVASVSIPMTILATYNNPALVAPSAVMAGASSVTDKLIQNYESKNNWVSFIDYNNQGMC